MHINAQQLNNCTKIPKTEDLIFGKNKLPNIVNISYYDGAVSIYQEINGEVKRQDISYSPWMLCSYSADNSRRLIGNQHFKYRCEVDDIEYEELRKNFKDKTKWFPRSIEEGFMLLNGYTYFKNMKPSDVSILSFDIEATTLDPKHKDAKVLLIANTYRNQGQVIRKLFDINTYSSEKEMIADWCLFVRQNDPSIICGHNIFSYDLPYLIERFGQNLPVGRDGEVIEVNSCTSKFRKDGSQQYEYYNMKIPGREIVDTFFLSIKYDVARQFPSYSLKSIIEHLGMEKEGRIKWDFKKNPPKEILSNIELWQQFKEYCIDDGDDALKLFDLMASSFFYFNQSVPKTFQQMINEATGSQLDSIMIRSYLQEGYSQPKSSESEPFEGAISMGIPGIYSNVRKVDVASLYPSIMLQYNIYNKIKDPNRNMLQILEYFRDERLSNKKKAKETGDQYYKDLEQSQKIAINSMYGFMGTSYLLYNYPYGAETVTRNGREILLKGVEWATGHTLTKAIKKIVNEGTEDENTRYEWVLGNKIVEGRGYQLVNVDTDSFSVTNGINPTKEEFDKEIQELNSIYPELIKWESDGVYDKMIVVKAKNYVMKSNGKVKFKGSSILDAKKEPVLRELLQQLFQEMLCNSNINTLKITLPAIYMNYIREAYNITDINRWTIKKTITKAILESPRLNESKVRDALKGKSVQEGDKIWLYESIDGMKPKLEKGLPVFYKDGRQKMVENTIWKLPEDWNRDENKLHYVERVHDTVAILENIIDLSLFIPYHKKKYQSLLETI